MQSLALLLLLGVVASTMFGFAPSVLAQETPDEEVVEETDETMDDGSMEDTMEDMPDETMEDTAEEEITDDAMEDGSEEMTDDVMEDDSEMETVEDVASPLQQLKSGVDPHEIQCGDGLQLVFKASNFRPMCIKESSHTVLLQRGWVSDHDPSHEDLMGMLEGVPKDEVMEETMEETDETMDETDGEINLEEEVEVEEDATSGNGTEPTPQSYTIELSEAMEMGAN